MKTDQASKIAELNDAFRKGGLGVMVTNGVQALPDLAGLLEAVREFDEFSDENDPYREHDFGALLWGGAEVFWKIDYYDRALLGGENPLSPNCRRILTVMTAEEY